MPRKARRSLPGHWRRLAAVEMSIPGRLRYALDVVAGEAEWLDAEAAARYFRLPVDTIYRMVRDGQLPALRFPVRIARHDLERLPERCRIKPGELAHLNRHARQHTAVGGSA